MGDHDAGVVGVPQHTETSLQQVVFTAQLMASGSNVDWILPIPTVFSEFCSFPFLTQAWLVALTKLFFSPGSLGASGRKWTNMGPSSERARLRIICRARSEPWDFQSLLIVRCGGPRKLK